MDVKLSGTLPKSEATNGLDRIYDDLSQQPDLLHVAVIVLDAASVTLDTDSGEACPKARIRRIEPIVRLEDRKLLEQLVVRAFEERTGKTVLPLELEDELRAAFHGFETDGEGDEN